MNERPKARIELISLFSLTPEFQEQTQYFHTDERIIY